MNRGSGILLHISSLDSKYGIGTLGQCAYDFIDCLKEAKQKYWQILPLAPTGYGDSPYQGLSAFACNPYFIDLDLLIEDGLLRQSEVDKCDFSSEDDSVDYFKQFANRRSLLKKAHKKGIKKYHKEFIDFVYENSYWIFEYSLYFVIKEHFNFAPIEKWDKALRERQQGAMLKIAEKYEEQIEEVQFEQFLFNRQWKKLKEYANESGISIIGDIPIYVSSDSDCVWAKKEMFLQDGSMSGIPPDAFSSKGHIWGTPLYNWNYLKNTGYDWWIKRVYHCAQLFDYIRIDHFRGFESYYKIPLGKDAKKGSWEKGPGADLFRIIEWCIGKQNIIAEDLGLLTDDVLAFLGECGYPGVKVLQFAFDETGNMYLPHNYTENCLVYTGTHDNDTTLGWYSNTTVKQKKKIKEYLGTYEDKNIADRLVRLASMSNADICIIPMQDILEKDEQSRMNTPAVASGNWKWRLKPKEFNKKVINKLKQITISYGR